MDWDGWKRDMNVKMRGKRGRKVERSVQGLERGEVKRGQNL